AKPRVIYGKTGSSGAEVDPVLHVGDLELLGRRRGSVRFQGRPEGGLFPGFPNLPPVVGNPSRRRVGHGRPPFHRENAPCRTTCAPSQHAPPDGATTGAKHPLCPPRRAGSSYGRWSGRQSRWPPASGGRRG